MAQKLPERHPFSPSCLAVNRHTKPYPLMWKPFPCNSPSIRAYCSSHPLTSTAQRVQITLHSILPTPPAAFTSLCVLQELYRMLGASAHPGLVSSEAWTRLSCGCPTVSLHLQVSCVPKISTSSSQEYANQQNSLSFQSFKQIKHNQKTHTTPNQK